MSDHFPVTSRYHPVATAEWVDEQGRPRLYLRRRFVPDPQAFVTVQHYQVVEGDRLDRLAAQVQGDPEQFWRLADANGCLQPQELEVVGQQVRLTLPLGMHGGDHA